MTPNINQKNDILEQLFSRLKGGFKKEERTMLQSFISHFYRDVVVSDLICMSQEDHTGLTVSLWREFQDWRGSEAKIKIFNPDVEQDEWQSTHTIISVICSNMPFVIDTIKLVFDTANINLYRIFQNEFATNRTKAGKLTSISGDKNNELVIYFEIDQTSSDEQRNGIKINIENALKNAQLVVMDYQILKKTLNDAIKISEKDKKDKKLQNVEEHQAFLQWLLKDKFTFIASDQFIIENGNIKTVNNSQLGLLKQPNFMSDITEFESIEALDTPTLLHFGKGSQRAMVHRIAYPDVIYVKHFNESGKLISGYRFIGLYTASVYSGSPTSIPVVREKVSYILEKSGYSKGGPHYKELSQIIHTFPREDLLLSTEECLLSNSIDILHAQERKELKLFMRSESNKHFVIALLFVPRDVYCSQVRYDFKKLIHRTLPVHSIDYQTYLSESSLTRVRLVIRLEGHFKEPLETQAIENRMKQLIKPWTEELQESLIEQFGEEKGVQLTRKYYCAFPTNYQSLFSSRIATADIERIETLFANPKKSMALRFYRSLDVNSSELKLKLFHQNGSLTLSSLIPILENLGLTVAEEYPYNIKPIGESEFWIYDFTLIYEPSENFDPEAYRGLFSDAFLAIWYGASENDSFNNLILGAAISWRDVSILRAYAKYLKQIRFGLSHDSIAKTLFQHSDLVMQIIKLFSLRFDPRNKNTNNQQEKLESVIIEALNDVNNLNDDRVLRKYVELIMATLRTNYYQKENTKYKEFISFKLEHAKIKDLPQPSMHYEVFVYSPSLEGVHLRGGKVARGGLRWSDREEDFRTEVLGLVKAQQVKNSVIVPVGAKGGFFAKKLSATMDRETFMAEGIRCYKIFISALLDITDNLNDDTLIPPTDVVRYDGNDPYLVVAADKGTATFSDIANELATDRSFWLNDAFASGGSNGYDHKQMGITAKGAWISVQRHFRELGIDVQKKSISVIGIGDMAGDVFGNGMLSSTYIALLGAFNHLHIFIDPTPLDLAANFKERKRLFETSGTGWNDYDKSLLSPGGNIFDRNAKSISVSPEMAKRFDIYKKEITPTNLIKLLLKAQVDLLWNGGIGTYAKGEKETHVEVGDKANDILRINGNELRCKVVGEGGNLGFTQMARIGYSLSGGLCFTDAIDNAAGVNCSDLEVNIKILLDKIVASGDLTVKQRNALLVQMTDEVSEIVLKNNYRQAQSISLSYVEGYKRIEEYRELIFDLEEKGILNRALEFIPNNEELNDRKNSKKGPVRPVISVMLSYAKNEMKEQLAIQKVAKDPYLLRECENIFPNTLVKKYKKEIYKHPLINEIVATQVSNDLLNTMGSTFVHRIISSIGCSFLDVSKAWIAARDIFTSEAILHEIEMLDNQVDSVIQSRLMSKLKTIVRHGTRWLIRNHRDEIDTGTLIRKYKDPLAKIVNNIDTVLMGKPIQSRRDRLAEFKASHVPDALAIKLASPDQVYSLLNVISVAMKLDVDVQLTAEVYFFTADKLKLFDVEKQLALLPIDTKWQTLARESMRDDLESQQANLTEAILKMLPKGGEIQQAFDDWESQHTALEARWYVMVNHILHVPVPDYSMCQVALAELLVLSQN
ncbi:MAG: NAD-glutamate dehydrogenase [Psychromonas sp.]|nr:NAD-glutamate dehydrogenase [Psychromonas sp.]